MKNLIFIILFTPLFVNAQFLLVIDKESRNAIPFASVEIFQIDIQTNCDGNGRLDADFIKVNTPIVVTSKGYFAKSFLFKKGDVTSYTVELEKSHITLNEVIISPTTGIIQDNNLTNVFLKKINQADQILTSNLMGLISSVPGVYSIHTGAGISKPVIRGMSGLKVVTFLNGLRIENQQWANDHGLNFTGMGIKSVEIVKGPSSLLYGADALGGVLYFIDEDYLGPNSFKSSFETRFESNTLSTNNIASLKMSSKKVRFNLYAGYKSAAEYQIPNGDFIKNSSFNGKSLKTALGFSNQNWILNVRYNFNSNEIGLPGHTHSLNPIPEEFQLETQSRERILPLQQINDHYLSIENKLIFKDQSILKFNSGVTSNSLTELEEKVTIPGIKMLLTNIPYNLSYLTFINEDIKWISGAQGMFTKNTNDDSAINILIPNSTSNDYGAYSLFQYSKEKFESQIGFRYDLRHIEAENLSHSFSRFNGSLGMVFQKDAYSFRTNFSSGFRPPHLSEMLADGVHHGTNRYEIGSKDLESEFANQFDVSFDYKTEHLILNVNPFFNSFINYIYVEPTAEYNDGYQVYVYSQASSAKTYGGEVYLHYHPHFAHRLHLEQDFSYVIGEDNNNNPLPLIPQTRINSNVKYEFPRTDRKLQINSILLQRTKFLDKKDVSTFETSSDNYQIYNVEGNFSFQGKQSMLMKLGIRNLFNERYINHLSNLKGIGLPSPGINFYISINYLFN
jgi:iron complex outermembrane receptor protein